jgi:uncharacterized repeat protein (TIGR02543 family)
MQTLAASGDFGYQSEMSSSLKVVYELAALVKKLTSLISTTTLILGLLATIPFAFTFPATSEAANPTCVSGMATQTGLSAVPAHGKVFYIDSGVTPKVDAAYIGYRIENTSGSTKTGLWVSIGDFVGGKVSLANPLDQYQQMDPITNTNYKTAFFLVKASGGTTATQAHTIKIYDRRPDLSGASAVLTCDFSFTAIKETIKANANKVKSVVGTLSPSTATLGGTLTVSVTGDTGKVGAGQSPDGSIIWVSPAAVSTWPTRSLRLESTSIVLNCGGSTANITLTDSLIQSNASTCFSSANGSWTGSYVFRIIGPGPSSLSPSPVANIASGTQYKHSDITGLNFVTSTTNSTVVPVNLSGVASSSFTVNVTASSTVVSSTSLAARIRYTITLSTTSTTAVEVDEIIDRPAAGTTYITGSSTLNGSATSDPSYLASEASLSPPPPHYIGPFSVVSGSNVVITYIREIPCSSTATGYSNTVYAKTGDQILGQTATTIPGVTVTTTSGASACTVAVADNPQIIAPTTQTNAATLVTASSATLNGYSNAYGGTSVTTYFKYSRDRNVVTGVTTTTSQPISGSSNTTVTQGITGLSSGTTYYFQIVVTSPTTTTTNGAILSFTTDVIQASPSVITSAATTVTSTTGTLNGTINPNLTPVTGVQFVYAQSATLPDAVSVSATGVRNAFTIAVTSATGIFVGMTATGTQIGDGARVTAISGTTITLSVSNSNTVNTTVTFAGTTTTALQMDDGNGTLVAMTLGGSGATDVFLDITGLASGTKYYFKLRGTCTVNATYCPNGFVDGAILNFTTGAPNVVSRDATLVGGTSATINGTVTQAANTDKWKFVYCAYDVSTCNVNGITSGTYTTTTSQGNTTAASVTAALSGLTAGTVYYFQILGMTSASDPNPVSYGAVLSFETLRITTSTLASGSVNIIYSSSVAGSGGSGSYDWSVTSGLPTGLTMSTSGLISGTPTTAGTYSNVVARMSDPFYGTFVERTLEIVIGAETFTVTFNANSGSGSMANQTANTSTTLSANTFTRTGYTFAGWGGSSGTSSVIYLDQASYSFTSSTTLYAQWTPDQYVVTYDPNGSGSSVSPTSATFTVGGTALTLPTPTRTGYTFTNWYTLASGGSIVNSPYTPTSSTTIYARWTANQYVITYDKYCTAATVTPTSATFTVGGTALTPPTPSGCTGYTFAGWYTQSSGGSAIPSSYSPSASGTIYAQWTLNQYVITFNSNTGAYSDSSTSKTATLDYNSNALAQVPAVPTKTGHTLLGWNTSSTASTALGTYSVPASTATLYAVWSENSYVITFDAITNGGAFSTGNTDTQTVSVKFELDAISFAPSNPSKSGETFIGWNTNANAGTALGSYTVGAASATLYAIYVAGPVLFTVTFNGNSPTTGSPASSSAVQSTAGGSVPLSLVGTLEKTHYTFGGWNLTGNGTPLPGTTYIPTSNVTLYAIWVPVKYTITYTVNPVGGGTVKTAAGSAASTITQSLDYLSDAAAVTATANTGYTFTGWADSASLGSSRTDAGVTGAITYTANFTKNTYSLTYTAGTGGSITSGSASQSVEHGSNGSAVTVTPSTGYRFVKWSDESVSNSRTDSNVTQSLSVNAIFELLTFSVTYVVGSNGVLTGSATQTVSYGSDGTSITVTANSGYTFSKWNEDDSTSRTRSELNVTANKTFTAIYTLNTYTITFDTNGGVYLDTTQSKNVTLAFNVNALDNVPSVPTYTGYSLVGWATSSSAVSALATYPVPAESKTLYAVWSPNPVYTVTFNSNYGTATTRTQSSSSSVALASNAFTRDGYSFGGWSTASGDGKAIVYSDGATYAFSSDITIYAQWTADAPTTYTITYATNNSDGGTAPANTTGNGSVTLRSNSGNLTRSGYTFGGWNTATGCTGTNYSAGGSFNLTSSVTLYPCWNAKSTLPQTPEPQPQPRSEPPAKIKPLVVWKNPNAIKTTTTLSTTQLNAVATISTVVTPTIANPMTPDKLPSSAPTIAGTYVYTPILPTVVTAGVNQVTTITSVQNAMTGTTKTVQTTTTPSVSTNTSSTTNVEEKPVLGQGVSLAPGLHKMKVVFIPTDSITYEPAETEVEILVQAETKVNWADPAPIKKTTPVGPGQLNATGIAPGLSNNVPGTYKYDIPEGTTLAPGKYPVKVTFTPTDPNYLPSTGEVTITVVADINPLPTPIITPANTASVRPITNTTSSATSKVIAVGNGLSAVATSGVQVSVLPQLNFSGKTTVTVSVTDEGETKDVIVPVTVLPLPAVTPLTTPNTKGKSTISWKPSPNATEYEVIVAGKNICTTSATSCSTTTLIGPNSVVQVVAKGNDETVAPVAPATYVAPKKPVTALVVYFDTNKFNLDAKDKADIRAVAKVIIEQGFKNIVVNGHTDIRGGVDNQVLSRNRSNATFNYLKELVPGLNVTIGAFASTRPAVKGTSAAALASNRRAEVGVF